MFLKPFAKYIAQYKKRLAVALFCMLGVGFLGTYNILLAKPALDVLFGKINYIKREAEVDERILKHMEKLRELSEKEDWTDRLAYWWKNLYYPVEHDLKRRLYGSSLLGLDSFDKPELLLHVLETSQSRLSKHLKNNFSEETNRLRNDYKDSPIPMEKPSQELMRSLTDDLNFILGESCLFTPEIYDRDIALTTKTLKKIFNSPSIPERFASITLTTETLANYAPDMLDEDKVRVNRVLFETAYPGVISGDRPMSLYRYAEDEGNKSKFLGFIAISLVTIALLAGLLDFGFRYNLSYVLYSGIIQLKSDIFRHIMHQDLRFFHEKSVGFLMSRITNDVTSIRMLFEILIRSAVQEGIHLVFLFTVLLVIDRKMTAVVFFMILPIFGLLAYFAHVIKKVTRKQKRKKDDLSAAMNESLGSVRLIKALATEDIECRRFDKHNEKLFYYQMKQRIAKFAASPIMEIIGSVTTAVILMWGGWAVLHEARMDASDFIIYVMALASFYKPIKRIARININWQTGKISAERILEMLALEATVTDPPPDAKIPEFSTIREGLSVREITFAYDDKIILDNISIDFPRGTTTAIVGRSGSGKTTLANLLLRLYDPDKGSILLDGHNLKEYRIRDLRRYFGIVTQETILFDDTVANNIAYGVKEVNRKRIVEAAHAANAHDFITQLDGGKDYDTIVGPGGSTLSGGQRQRAAIARAFYRNPDILLLDEATSSLDSESESAVQEAIERLMKDRTVIVIAHRLSTIMHADNIIVLDQGRLVEQGTHDELIGLGNHYATLYRLGEFSKNVRADMEDKRRAHLRQTRPPDL